MAVRIAVGVVVEGFGHGSHGGDHYPRAILNAKEAFVRPIDGGFGLRWFTPAVEIDLCGHATLASAHILWESGRLAADVQRLAGALAAVALGDPAPVPYEQDVATGDFHPVGGMPGAEGGSTVGAGCALG